jgi:glutamyl-tRNA reductase
MQTSFKSISLTYHKTSVEIRGLLSLDEITCKLLLQRINEFTSIREAMVLSTCNRTEVYYSSDEDQSEKLIKLLGVVKGVTSMKDYSSHFNILNNHDQVTQHLFEVSMGLDAQVIGDIQISNQIKHAYQWSADMEMAGPFLHRVMHTIFFTNKRVAQETTFRDGAASVSYATVEMAVDVTNSIINPKALVIGLGDIGTDVAKNLQDSPITDITLCNRSLSKATNLAKELNYKVLTFENLEEKVKEYDVIISSVASNELFLTPKHFQKDVLSFKHLIDMGIPRTIDPKVESIPGVLLYDIDQIQSKTTKALQKRIDAIPEVRRIIQEAISEFNQWALEMEVSPTINKLKTALEAIRQEEIDRYTKNLSDHEMQKVEKITSGIMQKIIKLPVLQLKAACQRGEAETLVDVLNELFNLEKKTVKEKV